MIRGSAYKEGHTTETALLRVQNDLLMAMENHEFFFLVLFSGFLRIYTTSLLCPSPTVPNLLQNLDKCKKFEIHAYSSLSKGQMHKIIFFFCWAPLKVRK